MLSKKLLWVCMYSSTFFGFNFTCTGPHKTYFCIIIIFFHFSSCFLVTLLLLGCDIEMVDLGHFGNGQKFILYDYGLSEKYLHRIPQSIFAVSFTLDHVDTPWKSRKKSNVMTEWWESISDQFMNTFILIRWTSKQCHSKAAEIARFLACY